MKLKNITKSITLIMCIFPMVSLSTHPTVESELVVQPTRVVEIVKAPQINTLIEAMIQVESEGKDDVIGDTHLGENYAVGALQIRPIMIREVNRILKLQGSMKIYKLVDRFSREKSIEMFNIWRKYHHPKTDFEKIARNWNGGAKGYLNESTFHYWTKVQLELNK